MNLKLFSYVMAAAAALVLTGCVAPIGADHVSTREAYEQVEANALSTGKPSAATRSILHRYGLDELGEKHPDQAVIRLHERALVTGERGLLFALSEMSYVAGDHIRRSVKPWDQRDARDFYLGSAVYAWLFLFGDGETAPPSAFDRRFRDACDFYNYGLGLAFLARGGTNGAVTLPGELVRKLPVGELRLKLQETERTVDAGAFEEILLADQLRVRGLSVRNREPGLGAPMVCVQKLNEEFGIHPTMPATLFLNGPQTLMATVAGSTESSIELISGFNNPFVTAAGRDIPLEYDLTTFRAYTLTQSRIWNIGRLQFLAPAERIKSQLIPGQSYVPGRIPVVLVHGTFSSPVTWAEMANSLTADPVLRQHYQIWTFIYGSGNPVLFSIAELRAALTKEIERIDPEGKDPALRQMVVIGHSQGGLLTKCTAVDTGDVIWNQFSKVPLADLDVSEEEREKLHQLFFLEPLPFVKRVIFISTPHRGSYLSGSLARRLAQKFVALPGTFVSAGAKLASLSVGKEAGEFSNGKMPTSLDGMSPNNPGLLALAELPVAPGIKANSIIPVLGEGDLMDLKDGVVAYSSAHVDYVESEFIVHDQHSCQNNPATIEEVRRILYEHLNNAE